jgi:hypothetical protein
MKRGLKAGLLVAVLVAVGAVAPAFAAGSQVTVGDLLKDIANLKKLPASDAVTAEAALRAAGFALPALDRSAKLTEGAVTQISNAMGLSVASANPSADFSRVQADRYLTAMGSDLSRTGNGDDGRVDSMSGGDHDSDSGKQQPHDRSPKKPRKPHKPKKPHNHRHRPGGWGGWGHGRGHR